MAVYTSVPAEALSAFLKGYDCGTLVSAKGIAEGVENSNYMVETAGADGAAHRYILTLYEKRVDPADLPFFIDLLDHLGDKGCQVPRFITDRSGARLQELCGRPACLIEFLTGVSVTEPTEAQSYAAGRAMGEMHRAVEDFTGTRPNSLGLEGWAPLARACGDAGLDSIKPGLAGQIAQELAYLEANWPHALTHSVIHADLFPDNVLMLGDEVTGLIDFYFSCTDIRAYDLAVMHGAWCFDAGGMGYHPERGAALARGYQDVLPLTEAERAAFPILCQGAAMRFLLTRAYDWLNTPADAMVTRKDPLAYLRRLEFYAKATPEQLLGAA
jgi:homoserine kinase type II